MQISEIPDICDIDNYKFGDVEFADAEIIKIKKKENNVKSMVVKTSDKIIMRRANGENKLFELFGGGLK